MALIDGDINNNTLQGTNDADTIRGSAGNDVVYGGLGNDTIYGGKDQDLLLGEEGNDVIHGKDGNDTIIGGEGDDYLVGGEGADSIEGNQGNDTLYGGSGADTLRGSKDQDTVYGGTENDVIQGDYGSDLIYGGMGSDSINGDNIDAVNALSDGNDTIYGDNGDDAVGDNDTIHGGGRSDTIFGNGGNDYINGEGGSDYLSGGHGDDWIEGGNENDLMYGGAGQDTLIGNTGDDSLFGGSGNDWIRGGRDDDSIDGGSDNDTILGDKGFDTITGGDGNDLIFGDTETTADASGSTSDADGTDIIWGDRLNNTQDGGNDTIYGGGHSDTIHGGGGQDFIQGNGGNDALYGDNGDDTILGGKDQDTIYGGNGADSINGNNGWDLIYGQDGDDLLEGGEHRDTIYGGAGADTLQGNGGTDSLFGNEGADSIRGGKQNDTIYGGEDDDTILGDNGADSLFGDGGNDLIEGGIDHDTMLGGDDDDTLQGNGGNDSLFGNAGSDSIRGGKDQDTVYGGQGDDTILGDDGLDILFGDDGNTMDLAAAANLVQDHLLIDYSNLNHTTADVIYKDLNNEGVDSIAGGNDLIEGGAHNDLIFGEGGSDTIQGNGGQDILYGGAGGDSIRGGKDNDIIRGGSGDDTINGDDGLDILDGGAGSDSILGGNHNDTIFGREGNDSINGNGGDDFIRGGKGNDVLLGGKDNDYFLGDQGDDIILGNLGADTLFGGAGDDLIYGRGLQIGIADDQDDIDLLQGNEGNDTLYGGAGNDNIRGGKDDDVLYGEDGNDHLQGDLGANTLYGGAGNDVFKIKRAAGNRDVIGDFNTDNLLEKINITQFSTIREFSDLNITQQGQDALIRIENQEILVKNTDASAITSSHFLTDWSHVKTLNIFKVGGILDFIKFRNEPENTSVNSVSVRGKLMDFHLQGFEKGNFANKDLSKPINVIDISSFKLDPSTDIMSRITENAKGDAVIDLADGRTLTLQGVGKEELHADNFIIEATPYKQMIEDYTLDWDVENQTILHSQPEGEGDAIQVNEQLYSSADQIVNLDETEHVHYISKPLTVKLTNQTSYIENMVLRSFTANPEAMQAGDIRLIDGFDAKSSFHKIDLGLGSKEEPINFNSLGFKQVGTDAHINIGQGKTVVLKNNYINDLQAESFVNVVDNSPKLLESYKVFRLSKDKLLDGDDSFIIETLNTDNKNLILLDDFVNTDFSVDDVVMDGTYASLDLGDDITLKVNNINANQLIQALDASQIISNTDNLANSFITVDSGYAAQNLSNQIELEKDANSTVAGLQDKNYTPITSGQLNVWQSPVAAQLPTNAAGETTSEIPVINLKGADFSKLSSQVNTSLSAVGGGLKGSASKLKDIILEQGQPIFDGNANITGVIARTEEFTIYHEYHQGQLIEIHKGRNFDIIGKTEDVTIVKQGVLWLAKEEIVEEGSAKWLTRLEKATDAVAKVTGKASFGLSMYERDKSGEYSIADNFIYTSNGLLGNAATFAAIEKGTKGIRSKIGSFAKDASKHIWDDGISLGKKGKIVISTLKGGAEAVGLGVVTDIVFETEILGYSITKLVDKLSEAEIGIKDAVADAAILITENSGYLPNSEPTVPEGIEVQHAMKFISYALNDLLETEENKDDILQQQLKSDIKGSVNNGNNNGNIGTIISRDSSSNSGLASLIIEGVTAQDVGLNQTPIPTAWDYFTNSLTNDSYGVFKDYDGVDYVYYKDDDGSISLVGTKDDYNNNDSVYYLTPEPSADNPNALDILTEQVQEGGYTYYGGVLYQKQQGALVEAPPLDNDADYIEPLDISYFNEQTDGNGGDQRVAVEVEAETESSIFEMDGVISEVLTQYATVSSEQLIMSLFAGDNLSDAVDAAIDGVEAITPLLAVDKAVGLIIDKLQNQSFSTFSEALQNASLTNEATELVSDFVSASTSDILGPLTNSAVASTFVNFGVNVAIEALQGDLEWSNVDDIFAKTVAGSGFNFLVGEAFAGVSAHMAGFSTVTPAAVAGGNAAAGTATAPASTIVGNAIIEGMGLTGTPLGSALAPVLGPLAIGLVAAGIMMLVTGAFSHDKFSRYYGTELDDIMHHDASNSVTQLKGGDDVFFGWEGWNIVFGGKGKDILFGGSGTRHDRTDELFGAQGNDYLNGKDFYNDLMGGGGDDIIIGGNNIDAIFGDDDTYEYLGYRDLHGKTGPDGNDTINAGGGDDVIYGGGGDDVIYDGTGNDHIYGGSRVLLSYSQPNRSSSEVGIDPDDVPTLEGAGRDRFVMTNAAGQQDVIFDFQPDKDILDLSAFGENPVLRFEETNDYVLKEYLLDANFNIRRDLGMETVYNKSFSGTIIYIGEQTIFLMNVSKNDLIAAIDTGLDDGAASSFGADENGFYTLPTNQIGNLDRSELALNATVNEDDNGNTTIEGASLNRQDEVVQTEDGDDILDFSDTQGDNYLNSGDGANSIEGGSGNETLVGGVGADTIDGNAGNDQLFGDGGADHLSGGLGDDILHGGIGDDILVGGSGNDILISDGADTISGGAGTDRYMINISKGAQSVITDFEQGDKIDLRAFDAVYDHFDQLSISNNGTGDTIILLTDQQNIRLVGVNASSLSSSDFIGNVSRIYQQGTANAETITGSSEADYMDGLGENDHINAGEGDDYIADNAGNDQLNGEAGNDSIETGTGNDTVTGGAGYDDFIVQKVAGSTTIITDFTATDDVINLETFDEVIDSYYDLTISDDGTDTTIALPDNQTILLQNILADAVVPELFIGNASSIHITGTDQADTLNGTVNAEHIDGKAGNDVIIGGNGADTINGGAGNDSITGGSDADYIIGGDGDDSITGGDGFDLLSGNAGNDNIAGGNNSSTLYGNDGDDSITGGSDTDSLIGGLGNDTIIASAGLDAKGDRIYGDEQQANIAGGADSIIGSNYEDTIDAGSGNDTVLSGAGNDQILGQDGDDFIVAGAGDDTILGHKGADTLDGADGDDKVRAGENHDVLSGGNGKDSLYGEEGNDHLMGGNDHDLLVGGIGEDTLAGGDGDDTLDGNLGNDSLYGGAGEDELAAGGGADTLTGGAGNDKYVIAYANGSQIMITDYQAGEQIDLSAFNAYYKHFSDLQSAITNDGTDTTITLKGRKYASETDETVLLQDEQTVILQNVGSITLTEADFIGNVSIQLLQGTANGDTITGSSDREIIETHAGDDSIHSTDGDDTILSGEGNDTIQVGHDVFINSGSGSDTIIIQKQAYTTITINQFDVNNDVIDLSAFDVNDFAHFGELLAATKLNDSEDTSIALGNGQTIILQEINPDELSADHFIGTAANPFYEGSNEADTLTGGNQNEGFKGLAGNDLLIGQDGDDYLDGGTGNDTIMGGNDNDTILGGGGHDQITTTNGHNIIDGQAGNDTITGGTHNDTIEGSTGADSIDGNAGDDFITGGNDNDILLGNIGNDTIEGNIGDDQLYGDQGNDSLIGGAGDDTIHGNEGNNTLAGQEGQDVFALSKSANTTSYIKDFTNGDQINLSLFDDLFDDFDALSAAITNNTAGDATIDLGDGQILVIEGVSAGSLRTHDFIGNGSVRLLNGSSDADSIAGNDNEERILGDADSDTLMGHSGNDTLMGDAGNDSLLGGNGNDSIEGGSENDIIFGESGLDTLIGGTGNDTLDGGNASDILQGGTGNDSLLGQDGDDLLLGQDNQDTLNGGSGHDTLNGGTGDDILDGDNGNDSIDGDMGNDSIKGGDGDDYLAGGSGHDTIEGGRGFDTIDGGAGNDHLKGDTSDDYIVGGSDNDTVFGNDGDDVIEGNAGEDSIEGGKGEDTIKGNDGDDIISGNSGHDSIDGNNGNDTIKGTSGDDTIDGGSGDDSIDGGSENDVLTGGIGQDTLKGYDGDDLLSGGDGADSLNGSDGDDTVDGGAGNDILIGDTGADSLIGADGNDKLTGGSQNDSLLGSAGMDTLDGGDGDDDLNGGEDNDTIIGGLGADIITGEAGADSILGNEGADTITGEGGEDSIDGGDGNDWLIGGSENDSLIGGSGADTLAGNAGDDQLFGGSQNDTIDGGDGNDSLDGGSENDLLIGGAGADTLSGYSGADTIHAGDGIDVIEGGTGNDTLVGGNDLDQYVFAANGNGHDVIQDDNGKILLDGLLVGQGIYSMNGVAITTKVSQDQYSLSHNGKNYDLSHDTTNQTLTIRQAGHTTDTITIENYQNGTFGIQLGKEPESYLTEKSEFLVNSYHNSTQTDSSVAVMSDGAFVITWTSYLQDGSGYGVYAQRFNADGSKNGNEWRVNDYVTDNQQAPLVAATSDNEFVISWSGQHHEISHSIHGKRYHMDGTSLGGEFKIGDTDETQTHHAIASLDGGGFISVWLNTRDNNIYAQRYHGDGTTNGNRFRVDSSSNNDSYMAVTSLNNDEFVVTWGANGGLDGNGMGVFGQIFNGDGSKKGTEFQINTNVDIHQEIPDVTALNNGGFVVVWENRDVLHPSGIDLSAQLFDDNGNKIGVEFVVNSYTHSPQSYASVTALSDGDFIIIWQSDGQNNGSNGIYGQRFNDDGSRQGEEFLINELSGSAMNPSVEALPNGGFIVTYAANGIDNNTTGIAAKIYDGNLDVMIGTNTADIIHGNNSDDTIAGEAGTDRINGHDGADSLLGGDGDDTLTGGNGNDTLTGGLGADSFIFGVNSAQDVITDFDTVNDLITIKDHLFANAGDALAAVNYDTQGATLTIDANNSIKLHGLSSGDLTEGHFAII